MASPYGSSPQPPQSHLAAGYPKYNQYQPDSPVQYDHANAVEPRTPSPTPSEQRELNKKGVLDWKTLFHWKFWFRREWLWYYVILVVILVVTALITIYHTQIVHWLTPVTKWLFNLRFGWLVPIGILFVLSFPPLFGHEIVAILCGLVWGLGPGFGIVCAGTFLGEVGNFYAFKYCCRARGEKLEKTKIQYACLAKVVRDGGFKIALIARLSAIPGHFTTAVFSTCGMSIFVFCIAAVLSLPKQFITVYLGVIIEQAGTGTSTAKSKLISDIVVAVSILITILAMWYIFHEMNKVKPEVIYQRRKARQGKIARAELYNNAFASDSAVVVNPFEPDVIPLRAHVNISPTPYTPVANPTIYAPQPQHPGRLEAGEYYDEAGASTDEVGWDMRPMQHARMDSMYGHPGRSTSDETITTVKDAYDPHVASSAYPQTHTYDPASEPQHHPMMQTPTQTRFATYPPAGEENGDVGGRLPSPPFHQTTMTGVHSSTTDSLPPPSYRNDAW